MVNTIGCAVAQRRDSPGAARGAAAGGRGCTVSTSVHCRHGHLRSPVLDGRPGSLTFRIPLNWLDSTSRELTSKLQGRQLDGRVSTGNVLHAKQKEPTGNGLLEQQKARRIQVAKHPAVENDKKLYKRSIENGAKSAPKQQIARYPDKTVVVAQSTWYGKSESRNTPPIPQP